MADPKDWKSIGVMRKSIPVDAVEKRWDRDMPAYARLRKEGLQPKSIDGCDRLEAKAVDRLEIEMGHLFPDKESRLAAREGMRAADDMNLGFEPAFGEAGPRDGAT